jgi:hypothetical protein
MIASTALMRLASSGRGCGSSRDSVRVGKRPQNA